ncbi:hypothetical protein [Roseomonas mucosa]|uniref:hypothetical protein n=1 Tax=Roseomonas mucosa TaxID=207340 RepID=UPI001FD22C43|nr:hypothetical protein [Roseomonas mucosa]
MTLRIEGTKAAQVPQHMAFAQEGREGRLHRAGGVHVDPRAAAAKGIDHSAIRDEIADPQAGLWIGME